MNAITANRMREIEEKAHNMGILKVFMMENAGSGVADYILHRFRKLDKKRIVVIAGTGNNGGDAFVAARHLLYHNAKVAVILLGSPSNLKTEEARINWNILERMDSIDVIFAMAVSREIVRMINNASVIIDGVFGIGLKGKIKEPHSTIIDAVNKSKAYKVAVDVPSGLDPDTGLVNDKCIKANATITFHRMKKGLLSRKNLSGKIMVEPIGIPPDAER
ncbi:MAG: NAD(P)H-hydrate epimerase [Nitrososphaerales archaeon]